MSLDGASSGAGRTAKGFPPATPTEPDERSVGAAGKPDALPPDQADDAPFAGRSPEGRVQNSVLVEDLRVSASSPIDGDSLAPAEPQKIVGEPDRPAASSRDDGTTVSRPSPRFIDLPRGSLVGEYEIEAKIGEGGMGAVYSAVHPILGKRVAIKVIGVELSKDEGAIARFRREARAIAQLASPHIVGAFGFGELADGRAYFVMEFLVGESLFNRLARTRLSLDEALDVIDHVARGLEAAHEAGIVHRDLKPENIFIARGGLVKLLDFGIVKLANRDDDVRKTQAGVLIGTPLYASPEQIKEAGSVDHRADIYSLGCVAFEMILGRVPFERATVVELIAAHLECPTPQPRSLWPDMPPALDALLFAMLAKDPAKRPTLGFVEETIEELRQSAFATPGLTGSLDALEFAANAPEASAEVEAPAAKRVAGPPVAETRSSRRTIVIVGGISVAVIAIITMIAIARSFDEPKSASLGLTAALDAGLTVTPLDVPAHPGAAQPPSTGPQPVAASSSLAMPDAAMPTTTHTPAPASSRSVSDSSSSRPASREARQVVPVEGELDMTSKPPCSISIDGKATGRYTPVADLSVEPGIHRVTLRNGQYGIEDSVSVQILPGQKARIVKDYSARMHGIDPNGTINPFGGAHP
jgi:serine/threonine-protein kinase